MHDANEPHKTETFGLRAVNITPMMWVFRCNRERPDEDKGRIVHILEKWVGRYLDRQHPGAFFANFAVADVRNRHTALESIPPDAVFASFLLVEGLAADWSCFGGSIVETLAGYPEPAHPLAALVRMGNPFEEMFGLPDLDPRDEETKVN